MKNPAKPRKRKLLGFAEQLQSGSVATGSFATGTHSAVPALPAGLPPEPPTIPAPASPRTGAGNTAAEKPRGASPVVQKPVTGTTKPSSLALAQTGPASKPPRPLIPKGIWVAATAVIVLVLAGPPLAIIAAAFTYPFLILMAALAVWKIFDLFQTS